MAELILHRLAEAELWQAVAYYEERVLGLGLQLRKEVEAYLNIIEADPLRTRQRASGYRRLNLKRFPFYLPYVMKGSTIWVLAVAHSSQRPDYWKDRRHG